MTEEKQIKDFYLLSDAVGQLTTDLLDSVMVQFPDVEINIKSFPFILHEDSLIPVLEAAKDNQAHIVVSFVKEDLHQTAARFCQDHGLFYYNVLHPIIELIGEESGTPSTQKPGQRHKLNDQYYKRIQALEFAVQNDDGRYPNRFEEADIVLLGISRTSKTPLSIYLAFQGYKVANLPLVPEAQLPEEIFKIESNKIIGLTNDINVLNKFRRERMRSYGVDESGLYSADDRIEKELAYANEVYERLQCPIINVADRSIEETATLILMFMNFKPQQK
ncbi:pyruvate, water dikinase regulatory protein [Aerococcus tenax]|uniref:pyruvate, water dikinase regulatory protein n=1 Tax=Aerococcus tenax TaxID=3078812 RepID=UPI0018A79702|nr:pyruvate, water dikinase regulatory protein [Aerococcus tenax]